MEEKMEVLVTEKDAKRDAMFAFVLGISLVLNVSLSALCIKLNGHAPEDIIHAVNNTPQTAPQVSGRKASCPFAKAARAGREHLQSIIRSPRDRFQEWIRDEVTRQIQQTLGEPSGQMTDVLLRPSMDFTAEPVVTPFTLQN